MSITQAKFLCKRLFRVLLKSFPKQIKKSTPQGVASLRGFCIHF
nr:MAG TPA: hypothetical protein [Caudoviricetes sp.]